MTIPCIPAVVTVLLATGPLSAAERGGLGGEHDGKRGEFKVLSGEPRLLIVNGYSTSFLWPQVLQHKIDRFLGKRVVEVRRATKGGTPIARWMDTDTGKPRAAWTDVLRPSLGAGDGRPVVVLAQQSLQGVYGPRAEGIRSADDRQRIVKGAKVLERYVDLLLRDGADEVFLAMHIYKITMEPAIGNERFALAEFLRRTKLEPGKQGEYSHRLTQASIDNRLRTGPAHIHAGPDVWRPTKAKWPRAFAADKVHPNSFGAEIMAHYWFEALLKHDGLKVPAWSREEVTAAGKGLR